ncbi:ECF transporter S component [Bifidobacterium bombi]|nr:ECF transporter S component [Bifidobacterium bombi]
MSTITKDSVKPNLHWRVVDIAVASAIGVVSSLIYWAAGLLYNPIGAPLAALVPGLDGVMNGLWLFAGPLALIIVRKPGAGVYAEVVAGVLEALLGNSWGGLETVAMAVLQGLGAEIVFACTMYKVCNLLTTMLSGTLAGVVCWAWSFFKHLQGINLLGAYGLWYLVSTLVSGALIAGVLMWYLYVALAKTGALDKFASGRAVRGMSV